VAISGTLTRSFGFNTEMVLTGEGNKTIPCQTLGRAVQVDPFKPKLKPPGTNRLKLKCDVLLSTSTFSFTLRRYT